MYRQFISDMWGGKDDGKILIWGYDGDRRKQSVWCETPEEAANTVEAGIAQKINIYIGAGLAKKDNGKNARMLKSEVYAIAAFWLDLDIADPVHQKNNLPRSTEEALSLLAEFPFDPSYVIHSGHGLQAWWMLKEPWYFRSPGEREDAEQLEKRLIYFFKQRARAREWDVDSVFNLDRVMRIPGTTNYKSAPVPVTVITRGAVDDSDDSDVFRYNYADFEQFLPLVSETAADSHTECSADIVLDAAAEPPFDKFRALMDNDPKFADSFNKARKDFPSNDYSMSTYDYSLARIACAFGWSNQEVCDLLIAFRRQHGADLKMQNLQYYQRTIVRARREAERAESMETISSHAQSQSPDDTGGLDPNSKEALLQALSSTFGVQLIQIKRYIADPPTYVLVTGRGNITLGDVDNLIGQRALRSKIAAVAGVYIRKFKEKEWDDIAQTLLNCCMDVALDPSASEEGAALEWLEAYLDVNKPLTEDRTDEAISQSAPFIMDGGVAIFGMHFRKWLKITQQERLTGKQMGILFRSVGARSDKVAYTNNGKPTTKSIWIIPDNA